MSALLHELAMLDAERREALRADDARVIGGQGYRWPEVAMRADPERRRRTLSPAIEQLRALVRADLEVTQ